MQNFIKQGLAWARCHQKPLAVSLALKIAVSIAGLLYYFGDALPDALKISPASIVTSISEKVIRSAGERGLEILYLQNEARENDPGLCVVIVSPFLMEGEPEMLFSFLLEMKIRAHLFIEEARLGLEAESGNFEESFEQALDILQERVSLQNAFIERAQARAANEIKALMENVVKKPQGAKRWPI